MVENKQMLVDIGQSFFGRSKILAYFYNSSYKILIQKGKGNGPLMPWQPISFAVI